MNHLRDEPMDALGVEVFHHLFSSVAEEMGAALQRSAFSVNIKERLDFSCAIFGAGGELIAQAAHLPVHLGATPLSVAAVLEAHDLGPGDIAFHNDPYSGGTHLPDITAVAPVFARESGSLGGPASGSSSSRSSSRSGEASASDGARPLFYVVSRAHHADVGGAFPGSMAPARDVHGEGLRLPAIRIVRGGVVDGDLLALFLANVRVPTERRADLFAQVAASRVGEARLQAMISEYGGDRLGGHGLDLVHWTAATTAARIAELPRGEWSFEDSLEGGPSGLGAPLPIRLRLASDGTALTFDFSDTAPQALDGSPVNTTLAVTVSAVFYGLRLLLPVGTPTNAGVLEHVSIVTLPGTICDADYPAPVAAGNVETSQRLVDVVLGALAQVLPGEIPAASSGTMNNLSFGGARADGREYTHYETHGGGAGGGPLRPGAHGVQTHMTNTRNSPVEALEIEMPVEIVKQTLRRGSGGAGEHPGGDGIVRRLRFTGDVRVAWMGERQRSGPYGLCGGASGSPGEARVQPSGQRERSLDPKAALDLKAGSEIEIRTPGGGGFGRPAG